MNEHRNWMNIIFFPIHVLLILQIGLNLKNEIEELFKKYIITFANQLLELMPYVLQQIILFRC